MTLVMDGGIRIPSSRLCVNNARRSFHRFTAIGSDNDLAIRSKAAWRRSPVLKVRLAHARGAVVLWRHCAGGLPMARRNARLNASSDS
jgi:hypothetical protein